MRYVASIVVVLGSLFALCALGADPPAPRVNPIDPKADAVLKQMGEYLASAKRFSVTSYGMIDQSLDNGQKVQIARNQKVTVRRPDGITATVAGDFDDVQFWYDGKTVTLLNVRANTYGVTEAPATLDATFDMLAEKYGLAIPLADLLFADPYKTLIANVHSASYLGTGYVLDVKCHHLAFRQEGVDWQIWVEQGDKPLPRKVVITYKESAGHPQFIALLSDWNLAADAPDAQFVSKLPADAKKVPFGPAAPAAGDAVPKK